MKHLLIVCICCMAVPFAAGTVCISELQADTLPSVGYIGIWADQYHSDCDVFPAQYTTFDVWIWCLPSYRGLNAAEFAVGIPPTVIILSTVQNSDITVSLGTLTEGISVGYGECQPDWTYTHHLTCMNLGAAGVPDSIDIIPHPDILPSPAYRFANCECGYPIEPCNKYTPLRLNQICNPAPPQLPHLVGITVESATTIRATFDMCISTSDAWRPIFNLLNISEPIYNSIYATQTTLVGGNTYDLTLERAMRDSTTYMLCMYGYVMSCDGYYNKSALEFTFLDATATLLQSCSASFAGSGVEIAWELSEIDAGVEFAISRSENGGEFIPLDVTGLSRSGLAFSFVDTNVEPGKRYTYKVEYTIDGASRLLFISEEIRTPAALLALDQNRPNPFNPSTTISFTLPGECAVRLEVYDVSGRLVARLINGERRGAGLAQCRMERPGRLGQGRGVGDLRVPSRRGQGDDLAQDVAPAVIDSGLIISR